MSILFSELQVLTRAVHHPNLSTAAQNVGLSQPQLSRIIKKIEDSMGLLLLDRSAKRKSGWLPIAHQISESFLLNERKLELDLEKLREGQNLTHLRVGTLEGLIPLANSYCMKLIDSLKLGVVELDVLDIMALEEGFESQNFDIIFSFREMGRRKYKYARVLGYQEMKPAGKGPVKIVSPFEYERNYKRISKTQKIQFLISNSLAVRRYWLESNSGEGLLPSEIKAPKNHYASNELPVMLIGSDLMPPSQWQVISSME